MIANKVLINKINKISGVDVLAKSRQREIVEARGLLIHVLNTYYKMGCTKIRNYFIKHGKEINHATILHSIKNWEIYAKYNPTLNVWLNDLLETYDHKEDSVKQNYIKNKIDFVNNNDLEEVYSKVKEHYQKYLDIQLVNQIEVQEHEILKY